jgi:hypothetical protein
MRGLSWRTISLRDFAHELLEAKQPMNLRQLHYEVFGAAKIDYDNATPDYKRLSRVTSASRRRHRQAELKGYGHVFVGWEIPHEWIVDELRLGERVSVWNDVANYVDTVRDSYRRDLWQDQPVHVEVWAEKASVLGSLRPVTREFGLTLRACRGFGSTGMEGQIGNLFAGIEKPINVFYLGDHDASGDVIDKDIHRRVEEASGKEFTMKRLAIFPEDIKRFNLPPQKIKSSDSRSAAFKKKYGEDSPTVELDALPVDELRSRVRRAIEELTDADRWNRQIKIQEAELKCIVDLAARMKLLPPVQTTT